MIRAFIIAALLIGPTAGCREQSPPAEGETETADDAPRDEVPSPDPQNEGEGAGTNEGFDIEQDDEPLGDVSDVGAVDSVGANPPAQAEPARPAGPRGAGASPVIEEYDVGEPAPTPEDVVEPLPKKEPIAPSGVPIDGPSGDPIEGPSGEPIEGPRGVPIEGPSGVPIEGDAIDRGTESWGD